MSGNTKIKLCGLKSENDIELVNRLKPDYVGFVMWDKSHRNVSYEKLKKLKGMLNHDIKAVGVFVDEDVNFIAGLANEGLLDILQLHGSEDEEYIIKLRSLLTGKAQIIKAFKAEDDNLTKAYNSSADFILFDPGKGDGMTFAWDILKNFERPYFLAGGLNSDNVREAIDVLKPYAVDVSSGIETDKVKDPLKAESFVNAVRGM